MPSPEYPQKPPELVTSNSPTDSHSLPVGQHELVPPHDTTGSLDDTDLTVGDPWENSTIKFVSLKELDVEKVDQSMQEWGKKLQQRLEQRLARTRALGEANTRNHNRTRANSDS